MGLSQANVHTAPRGEKLPGISHHVYLSISGKMLSTCRDGNLLKVWEVGKREPVAESSLPLRRS